MQRKHINIPIQCDVRVWHKSYQLSFFFFSLLHTNQTQTLLLYLMQRIQLLLIFLRLNYM